ncbi:hypothetical protein M409DRAFT_58003 [Zasmidium cellare ATCC 36951]|uniref:Arrestin-like N-terminal domain-containing protein n=1 Tax=Zasmidium cellare ATCC 36951 TaxID=1080233 RepID=A0A6A6C713_ZASCE|nr:uncharacterized protein M409DRAFT_58003 [Zasmidium cellare ATCC 36951]KAF2162967.1 hypothetical protein M409DRAFT_58003 [Zasmidium cellare ATCC 36951]
MTGKMGLSVLSSQPTDPSLGVLHARLHLDDPKRIHYGSDDPVDGSVRLKFERNGMKGAPATELFGPLEVNLTLKGTMRFVSGNSAISDSSPQNESVFVNKTISLHTGPFRAAPGTEHDFPFSLNFPEHADAKHKTSVSAYQDAAGNWKFRQRLSDTTIEDLPPTLASKQKHAMVTSDMSIRYGLVLQVTMPGIDVRILTPVIEKEVLYDRPRVPPIAATTQSAQTTSFTQLLSVEHKSLLPPSDPHRTSSSRSLKSLFKSSPPLPKYAFNVSCTGIPQHIFIGQPITFPLRITPSSENSTTATTPPPEISLTHCTLSLIAHTHGRTTLASPSSEETHNTELLKEKPCDVIGFDSTTTAIRMGHIDVGTLSAVPSTFTHGDMRREYKLKIAIGLSCLGQNFHVTRMLGVVVHPPVIDLGDVGVEEEGEGNGVVLGMEEENVTPLPSYDAVVGGEGATPGYFEREPQMH